MGHKLVLLSMFLSLPLCARDLGSRPIVLVHGYGPDLFTMMYKLRRNLIRDGVRGSDILSVAYDSDASSEVIAAKIKGQVEDFLSRYPAGTRFDVIGHSFGGFIGLYGPLQSKFSPQLEKYISLTGWTHGQNHLSFLCGLAKGCGETLPLLIPYNNPFVSSFFARYASTLKGIKKCALYSPEDKMTSDPMDSGSFADGINVEVKGLKHFDFMNDPDVYQIMTVACYGEPAPAAGYEHEWKLR